MRLLKRFAQLSGVEKRSLIRVWFVVGAVRAALCVLPAGASRRVAARAATGVTGSVEQLVWAVEIASRYLPGATCLTQHWRRRRIDQRVHLLTAGAFQNQGPLQRHREKMQDASPHLRAEMATGQQQTQFILGDHVLVRVHDEGPFIQLNMSSLTHYIRMSLILHLSCLFARISG